MLCSRGVTKTIVLKSPDSDRVREVIVTSVLLPKSENENNRNLVKTENNCSDLGLVMERRTCKRRLDHLSLEEKILRKKLKNREAAQTSRDRKKARLEELETSVLKLQNENESLHEEVRSLKDERDALLRENDELSKEVWRLRVGGSGPNGPAAGNEPAPSLSPSPPPTSSPSSGSTDDATTGDSSCIPDDSWFDWLDEVPCSTPVVEELEQLANSLFAEASKTQESKPSQESMVGKKAESLESCWSSFLNSECNLSLDTNMEDKVTFLNNPVVENTKKPRKLPKLDITSAQNLFEKTLETPEIQLEHEILPTASNESVEPNKLQTPVDFTKTECCADSFEEQPSHTFNSEREMMEVDGISSLLSDGIDCVVNEEVVETTEYVDSSKSSVPTIVLTEAASAIELTSDDEEIFCPNLLKAKDFLEESSSDHGYESYDSPISEPEELVNLFPELWEMQ